MGTALPICLNAAPLLPSKKKSSGKDCSLAASLTVIDRAVSTVGLGVG